MKLIKFDAATAKGFNSGTPTIRFHTSGVITLTKAFIEAAKLSIGHKVSIVQDEENPDDWYLVAKDDQGFALREYKCNNGLCFNNAYIAKSIVKYMEESTRSIAFQIATEPTECDDENIGSLNLYAILIATAKCKPIDEEEEEEELVEQD